jgi:hypothetical protein
MKGYFAISLFPSFVQVHNKGEIGGRPVNYQTINEHLKNSYFLHVYHAIILQQIKELILEMQF